MAQYRIATIEGDGIGPEVTRAAMAVLTEACGAGTRHLHRGPTAEARGDQCHNAGALAHRHLRALRGKGRAAVDGRLHHGGEGCGGIGPGHQGDAGGDAVHRNGELIV